MIELRLMLYAVSVEDAGNLSRAAELLGITQPTLSHQIRRLEDQIGMPLFDRLGKTMRTTATGEIFIRHARAALRAARAAEMELSAFMQLDQGSLRIGAIQTYMDYLLPQALALFRQRFPNILVTAHEYSAPVIESMVASGKLDIGIAFSPALLDECVADVLFTEKLVLIANQQRQLPATMTLASAAKLDMAALAAEMSTRKLIEQQFRQLNLQAKVKLETNSVESLLRIVAQTDLVAIVPEQVTVNNQTVAVTKLTRPSIVRQAAVLRGRGTFQTPPALQFRRILFERNQQ
jgi:LysR family cyn operon transcriptional activator